MLGARAECQGGPQVATRLTARIATHTIPSLFVSTAVHSVVLAAPTEAAAPHTIRTIVAAATHAGTCAQVHDSTVVTTSVSTDATCAYRAPPTATDGATGALRARALRAA